MRHGSFNGEEENLLLPLLSGQALGAVLIDQDLFEVEGNARLDALELGDSHGPEILAVVTMLVLAAPHAWSVDFTLSQTGNVDKHAVAQVDPARVDDVHAVTAVNVDVMGVDVEEVFLLNELAGFWVGVVVCVLSAVEVLA